MLRAEDRRLPLARAWYYAQRAQDLRDPEREVSAAPQLRPKRRKNQARGAVPQASAPRQVVPMDTVDFGPLFAFTAEDIWSREVEVLLRPGLTSQDGVALMAWPSSAFA